MKEVAMAPRTDFAALLVVAASMISYGTTVLAQTIIEAKSWDEAISNSNASTLPRMPIHHFP
jgi:hypothetical protein